MKTAIVGATSSVGRELKTTLAEMGSVTTIGRKNCDVTFDLNDPSGRLSVPGGTDVLVHTAAAFGGKAPNDLVETESINVVGTLKVCIAAMEAKVKHVILISSMSACVNEDSIYFGIYALSKKHGEEVARLFCKQFSLPLTILRPSQIYGNNDSFRKHQPYIYSVLDSAKKGEDISIYGSRDALRNYIHVNDLSRIIVKVIQSKTVGTYSCTHPTDVSFGEVAQAALTVFNKAGKIIFLKDKPDIPDNIFEKDFSLYERIGYYPEISIAEGMDMIARQRTSR